MSKKTEIIIQCESCIHGYYCKILNPYRCQEDFSLAVNSNFYTDLKINKSEQIQEFSFVNIDN